MTATRTRPPRRVLLLLAAAVLALPACSSDPAPPAAADPAAAGDPAAPTTPAADPPAGGDKAIDACAMLEPAEIKALVPGAPTEGDRRGEGIGSCNWEDPETYDSIGVRIGVAGIQTDQLPPVDEGDLDVENGPDGIRFSTGGTVAEFIAGRLICEVQLVLAGKETKAQLVTLVRKIRSRVEG